MLEEASLEGKGTSRNGYCSRKIRTASGDFSIQIPRERFHLLPSGRKKNQLVDDDGVLVDPNTYLDCIFHGEGS